MRSQIKEDYELNDVVGPEHVAVLQLRATGSAAGRGAVGAPGTAGARGRARSAGGAGGSTQKVFFVFVFQSLPKQG
jgi:hypothetical protein